MLFKKNKILNYGPVLALLLCFMCFFSNFAKAASGQSYQIGLPQKDVGIDKVEYLINGMPQGSTDGVKYKSIEAGSKVNFLVKFNSFYANSKIGDFKIFSEGGVDSFIKLYVYDYDATGNIITREVSAASNVDPKQTYITSGITITEPETFEINFNGQTIKKDIALLKTTDDIILNEAVDIKYQITTNGSTVQSENVSATADGNMLLTEIDYDSTLKIEISAKDGYKFENSNITTENFGENCKVTQALDNNKMTINISNFQINDISKTPGIKFDGITKDNSCSLSINGQGTYGIYFDWYEPVEGKENTIKHITASPHYVKKGKYVFYVRHKTSNENYSAYSNKRYKIINLNGVEIDPTFDESEGKFERYQAQNDINDEEIVLQKETYGTSKHNFHSNNNGELYKFEVYLTGASTLSFEETKEFQNLNSEKKYYISFDESYTKYATPDYNNAQTTKTTNNKITYSSKLQLNDDGIKKYGFSKPNIYLVPTNKVKALKDAISEYEKNPDLSYEESEIKTSYENFLATYSEGYEFSKDYSSNSSSSENKIEGPLTAVLGPVVRETEIPSHFVKFPLSLEGANLSVVTEDESHNEIAKKCKNGYMVKCTENAENTHQNKFIFEITPEEKSDRKYEIKADSSSCKLDEIQDSYTSGNLKVVKGNNNTYTCTVENISDNLEITIEKYTGEKKKQIEFNCPGMKIKDDKDVSYDFSGGGKVTLSTNETSYKFKIELKEGFEFAKNESGEDIPPEVTVVGNETAVSKGDDGFYTINPITEDSITVNISGAIFKSEKPGVEIITNEENLKFYQYSQEATLEEITSKSQTSGKPIISKSDLTPGGSIEFYIAAAADRELNASLLGSAIAKLQLFEKLSSPASEWDTIKEKYPNIYKVTVTGIEESCQLSVSNQNQGSVTHYWTLTKSFELVPSINKIVNAEFTGTQKSTSSEITFEKNATDTGTTFDLNETTFDFTVSTADKTIYELGKDNYTCKFYSDKELTQEIDMSSLTTGGDEILSGGTAEDGKFKWKIDISNKQFEGSVPAISEYITVKNNIDYTKKADYIYEKIYVGIVLKPLDTFNIHFSYNIDGQSNIIPYSKVDNEDYKGIKITNIKVNSMEDEDSGEIMTYKIAEETDFDPKIDKAVNAAEKSFAIGLSEGYSYDDIIVSESEPSGVPVLPQESTKFSTLFKYPIISDLDNKDSFRINNIYSKDIYVHIKNLSLRQLSIGFPKQYIEGTDIHLMKTDSEGNTTEENATVESTQQVSYGENLKIRSRAQDGYQTDEISEFILYTSNGATFTFIDVSQSINGPNPEDTKDSDWTVNKNYEKLSKIVDEVRYKFTIDKGEKVFDIEFKGIKSNFDIQLRRKKKNFTISFPAKNSNITVRNLNGDEIDGSVSKSYKDSFSFSVTPALGIDITNLVVKDSDENIYNLINGYYTISSVEKDISIKITGIEKETRTITFTDYDDITYLDSKGKTIGESISIEYGSDYEFKIDFGSSISQLKDKENAIKVRLSSSTSDNESDNQIDYDYKSHKCAIKNLTENSKITIDGVMLNTYTLTLNKPDKINYTEAYSNNKLTSDEGEPASNDSVRKKITHGNNFSFRIVGEQGIDLSNLKVWLKKSENDKSPTQIVAIDNIYTIENIQGNYTVYTSDSKPTVCTVEIRTTTGVSCLDTNGNNIESKTEVNYGDTLAFRLSIDKIYDKSNPVIEIKGTTSTLSPDSDGYYRLENITENKILQITGVTKNTYKITFEEAEGVIYKTVKNKPFEKSMDVEYGDTLQFKITLMDAYDSSVPTVLLNDTMEISANAGIYKVEGINSNVTISVKNVKKNPEESAIEEITTVTNEISSSTDVDEIISATNAYNSLSDDQKELVTNLDELNAAQKSAGLYNHSTDGITVTGIDWYIKLVVTSLNEDEKAIEELNNHLDRKELINLYDIKLYDMLKNEVYKVPYGQEVTVTIPCPENISEYENIMVVHENSAGGIEYLDVNIKSNTAQFKTTSFSKFGIAGKKIPLDSSKLTNATVSVSSLVRNDDELKSLLGENAASEIGELINTNDEAESNSEDDSGSKDSSSVSSESKENLKDKAYNWAVKNELPAVMIVLILGFGILALILIPVLKKKSNETEKEKK